jgi:hypothetical protein
MIETKKIITIKREIWFYAPPQPSMMAVITEVGENHFWSSLPREGGQLLMFGINQKVSVRVSLSEGYYGAETRVEAIGNDDNKFYRLSMPGEFTRTQDRRFVRARYAANVIFAGGKFTSSTSLVNFSAGGIMVYLVPELEKILQTVNEISVQFKIDEYPVKLPVRLAWRRSFNDVPFAGFEFLNVPRGVQDTLIRYAIKYSKNT